MPRTTASNAGHDDVVDAFSYYIQTARIQQLVSQMGFLFGRRAEHIELGELLAETGFRVQVVEHRAPHTAQLNSLRKAWEQSPPAVWSSKGTLTYVLHNGKHLALKHMRADDFIEQSLRYLRARVALQGK